MAVILIKSGCYILLFIMKAFLTLFTILLFFGVYPAIGQTLISKGSAWKYLDDGTDQKTAWKEAGFNDSEWKKGLAIFKSGTPTNNVTTYLRYEFDYLPNGDETSLIFNALIDDAAIVYLNGQEVIRVNMPDGPVYFDTYALSSRDVGAYVKVIIPIKDIQDILSEKNLISVELHQADPLSSEIGWDLELSASTVAVENITHIRFGSTGDPLNGLTIAWKGQGTADSIAWGYTSGLENGKFSGVKSTSITGTRFEYTFPVLTAGSTVHYAISDSKDGVWTETRTYETASDASDDEFSFTVLGDSRSYPVEWGKISDATLPTDFTLFMGDIIANGAVASDWQAWFDYGEKFISRELIYHCVGNHDDDNSPSGFDNFLGLYTQPGNELYYSFTYGNAVFICLNTQKSSDTEQYNWLLSTLEANKDKTWKIVFFHKPFYTAPNHTGEMDSYFNTWWKAFDDYGVDMIFNGHTHNYQRTIPININVSSTAGVESYGSGEGQGRCQIVAGNAGAPISSPASSSLWWLDNSAAGRHFCEIDIDGDRLSMKAMFADHSVFDSLVIDKSISEITFKVDLREVTDLHDGGDVRVVFGDWDSSFVMTDTDGDDIYTFKKTIAIGTDLKYFYSYQNGADPETNRDKESVPAECADADGYRILKAPYGNLALPAVLYGSCDPAPLDITFRVDLGEVADLYDGGSVWLAFGAWDTSYIMTDTDLDSIYTVTVPFAEGTELKYFFAYQNGADSVANVDEEYVPVACSDDEGYRTLQVPDYNLILPAVSFGSCYESTDEPFNPEISIPIISGNDDGEEDDSDGKMDLGSSDLEIIFESEPQHVGMLFREAYIPHGAVITNAYVQFTCDVTSSVVLPDIYIYGAAEATVNEITGEPYSISSHPATKAKVDWSPAPQLRAGNATEAERTADISAVIEEIVGLDGWEARNNILIVIAGNSNQTRDINREVESYNGQTSGAPVLNVTFEATSSPEITFQIDMNSITDLYAGGAVWLSRDIRDTSYVMNDTVSDGIYSCTLPLRAGTNLKYFFSYQNGADPKTNVVEESAPAECGNYDGYRTLKVPHRNLSLNAVSFGSCVETHVMVSKIMVTTNGKATSVNVGATLQMVESVSPPDATDKTVTWSVDDATVATVDANTGLLTLLNSGMVKVTATALDASGVTGAKEVNISVISSVFVRRTVNGVILIYPNPTEGVFYIDNPSTDKFSYEVYSVSGKLVLSKRSITSPTTTVDMSGILKGMYIVKVRSAEISETQKIILK